MDHTVAALALSRAQHLGIDTGTPLAAPARTLAAIAPETDALADLIGRGGPDRPAAELRTAVLAQAGQERSRELGRQARSEPEPWLLAALGPRPPGGTARARWDDAAGRAVVYRDRHGITDPATPFGPVPADPVARIAREAAIGALEAAAADVGWDHGRSRDRGWGLGR